MALTTRTIPAMMNGISQQPPILRSPDQMEDEVNTWSQLAKGLGRRPPTQVVQKLTSLTTGTDYSIHHINRDIDERYIVIIKSGGIEVYDATTGAAKTVNAPEGWGYLDTVGDVYRATSIADYTFIVNTTKTVALEGVGDDQVTPPVTRRFPGGNAPRELQAFIAFFKAASAHQYRPNTTYSGGLTGTVPSADKLPATVCSGCVYKVLGEKESAFVSYYVMGDGTVWNETVNPGLINSINGTTMPWALAREADGTFTFAPFSWQPRRVGDQFTNPVPPFIGRTIRDVFFYQNRLGFVVDTGVVFSGAGDYGDFWRRTVLDYIDSDTVAADVATTDVAILDFALPFADGIMLFSRQHQFSLTNGDSGLSAHSIAITPVTRYVMAQGVRPTPMGSQAHFLTESRGFVSVLEYTRLAGSDPTEAANVTAHVPELLPKGASQMIPAQDLDALFVLNRGAAAADQSKMFAYQFFWDGDKKLQSAWRVWDFGDGKPISGTYESGSLFLLMARGTDVYLEKIDLEPSATSANQDHMIYLDRQKSLTGTYSAGTDTTTFALTYAPDLTKFRIVRGKGGTHVAETVISPDSYVVVGTNVTVPGNESGAAATLGHLYTTSTRFSQQFPVDFQFRPLTSGRLVLHSWNLNLTETAYLRAEVYPYGTKAQEFDASLKNDIVFAPTINSTDLILNERSYIDGPFQVSVAGSADQAVVDLVNDSPFGHTLVSGQWEGLYFSKALS